MTIKFGYTIVYAENVLTILDFYNRAFGFATKFLYEPSNDYGELDTGEPYEVKTGQVYLIARK